MAFKITLNNGFWCIKTVQNDFISKRTCIEFPNPRTDIVNRVNDANTLKTQQNRREDVTAACTRVCFAFVLYIFCRVMKFSVVLFAPKTLLNYRARNVIKSRYECGMGGAMKYALGRSRDETVLTWKHDGHTVRDTIHTTTHSESKLTVLYKSGRQHWHTHAHTMIYFSRCRYFFFFILLLLFIFVDRPKTRSSP